MALEVTRVLARGGIDRLLHLVTPRLCWVAFVFTHLAMMSQSGRPSWETGEVPALLWTKHLADSLRLMGNHSDALKIYKDLERDNRLSFSEFFSYQACADSVGRPLSQKHELSFLAKNGSYTDQDIYTPQDYERYRRQYVKNIARLSGYDAQKSLFIRDQHLRDPRFLGTDHDDCLVVVDSLIWIDFWSYLNMHGWPDYDYAISNLLGIAQHAIRGGLCEISQFNALMPYIQNSVWSGKLSASTYCYFYDLYLVFEKHAPQRFGTVRQYDNVTLFPCTDPDTMDTERRSVGYYLSFRREKELYGTVLP